MIIDNANTHEEHELVKHQGSITLKKSVGFPFSAHGINGVKSCPKLLDHIGNNLNIILQIGINRNRAIGIVGGVF